MRGNVNYSIPPSQLPLLLAPGEQRRVALCIEAEHPAGEEDTLELIDECGHIEQVALKTPVRTLYGIGSDGCRAELIVEGGFARRTFLTLPAPNPVRAGGEVELQIGLVTSERVWLEVVDERGVVALQVLNGEEIPSGINRLRVNAGQLASGSYLCRLRTGSGGVHVEKLVVEQ
jgi:hypothetical protein